MVIQPYCQPLVTWIILIGVRPLGNLSNLARELSPICATVPFQLKGEI